jgi:hypothetical protein
MLDQLYYSAAAGVARVERVRPIGRPIWESDWDLCIVLDSARADIMHDLAPAFFDAEFDDALSVGSVTTEWLANTFHRRYAEEMESTAYVTANPHSATVFDDASYLTNADSVSVPFPSAHVVDREQFDAVHELWRTHATDHDAVPPETMLDATIEGHRKYDRVVAHWLQPHEPFLARSAPLTGGSVLEGDIWAELREGRVDAATVWESYEANLLYALAKIERLLHAIDGRILITSDHGNAFGEWGQYGHPFGWPHPSVRRVPWISTTSVAVRSYDPEPVLGISATDGDRDEQLAALGYR